MKKLKPIRVETYNNAKSFKYNNARVSVISIPNEDAIQIETMVRTDNLSPKAFHKVNKNKVVCTGIKLSYEAALSVMLGIEARLKSDGII